MCNIILDVIDMIQWVQISKREEEKIEMDRQFMTEYFEKMHENPISEAVKDDSEYELLEEEFSKMEAEFEKILGDDDNKNWKFYEEMMDVYEEKWGRIMFGAYLMGARDRERMLR